MANGVSLQLYVPFWRTTFELVWQSKIRRHLYLLNKRRVLTHELLSLPYPFSITIIFIIKVIVVLESSILSLTTESTYGIVHLKWLEKPKILSFFLLCSLHLPISLPLTAIRIFPWCPSTCDSKKGVGPTTRGGVVIMRAQVSSWID